MTRTPDFDDLVGSDLGREERERLEHVHNLLVIAGPPAELAPELESGPTLAMTLGKAPRRHVGRRVALLAAAVMVLLLVFLGPAGNWPMSLTATGLPELPEHGYYEVFLTRGGKIWAPCGTFRVESATGGVSVRLNAPYDLRKGDGWVVTRQLPGHHEAGPVVLKQQLKA